MAKVAPNSPAAQRRAAQKRLARQIKTGTYERSSVGKASAQARERQRRGKELSDQSRGFSSIADACAWGLAELPPRTPCYMIVFGRLRVMSGDEDDIGRFVWRVVMQLIQAQSLVSMGQAQAEAEAERLFTEIRKVVLRWRA
jgi:hypothetical protein